MSSRPSASRIGVLFIALQCAPRGPGREAAACRAAEPAELSRDQGWLVWGRWGEHVELAAATPPVAGYSACDRQRRVLSPSRHNREPGWTQARSTPASSAGAS